MRTGFGMIPLFHLLGWNLMEHQVLCTEWEGAPSAASCVQSTLRSLLKHLGTEQAWGRCGGGAGALSSVSSGISRRVWCENGRKCSVFEVPLDRKS